MTGLPFMYSSSSLLSEKQNPQQALKFFKWTFTCFCTKFRMWKCHCSVCCSWRVFGPALGCSGLSNWIWLGWCSRQFSKKPLKTNWFVFLRHLLLSFGTMLLAGLQTKTRFGNSLVLAFFCKLVLQLKQGPLENWVLQPTVFIVGAVCL